MLLTPRADVHVEANRLRDRRTEGANRVIEPSPHRSDELFRRHRDRFIRCFLLRAIHLGRALMRSCSDGGNPRASSRISRAYVAVLESFETLTEGRFSGLSDISTRMASATTMSASERFAYAVAREQSCLVCIARSLAESRS